MAINIREDGPADIQEENVVAEINITPLTDIFLVLLIIFMVTSSAAVMEAESTARSGVKVTLPKANAAGPVQQKKSDPVLTVTKDGAVYVGAKKIDDLNQLEAELRKALQEASTETVLVRGDQGVYLGKAVDIMTIAKRAGASHIGILTAAPK